LTERPKIKWKNDMKENLRIIKIYNRAKCILDRIKCKEVAEKAKTFKQ
jgi:hypothetical protein